MKWWEWLIGVAWAVALYFLFTAMHESREEQRIECEKRGGYLTVSGLRFALDDTKADMRRQARELQYEKERISTIARLITEWRAAPMGADGDAIIESIADLLE